MHKDKMLNKKLTQTAGILSKLTIKRKILTILEESETSRELMADFKNIWLMVSQALVSEIKNRVKNTSWFMAE
jgi:hypothetical protein